MEKTREEFVVFIRQAMNDRKSAAFQELYTFLVNCFVRADNDMNGKVCLDRIDSLIEEAAALPRLYGFAPKADTLYPSESVRKAARAKMFNEIDSDKSGYISLEQWIEWSTNHILGKVNSLPKDILGGSSSDVTTQEFKDFIKLAVQKGTAENRELYFFLLKCFQAGDTNGSGAVDAVAFDRMIERAAAAPRKHGLAPKTSDMFKSDQERLNKRKEYFAKMDTNKNGEISFNEWLTYAMTHIAQKAASV